MGRAIESLEHGADLVAGENDRQPRGALGAHDAVEPRQVHLQHVLVQEQEGAQRLVLGRGGDVPVDRQEREELRDFQRARLGRVPLAVEHDVAAYPRDVGFFGAAAVMARADGLADAVE